MTEESELCSNFNNGRRTRNMSLTKTDLRAFMSIHPKKNMTSTGNTFNPNDFYKDIRKQESSIVITYATRPKASVLQPKTKQLRQFTNTNSEFDMASTLFSFGKGIHEKDYHEFKTNYLIKFAKVNEVYTDHNKFFPLLSNESKTFFSDLHPKTKSIIDKATHFFFNTMQHDAVLDYCSWKEIIDYSYEIFNHMNKMLSNLFKELKNEKEKCHRLEKTILEQTLIRPMERGVNKKNDELPKIEKSKKQIAMTQAHKLKMAELQREDNQKMIMIYRLESELKDMTSLLDKNKDYYSMYLETQATVNRLRSEMDEARLNTMKDSKENVMKLAVSLNETQALGVVINEMEAEKTKLLNQIENNRKVVIDHEVQMKNLRNILMEETENFTMAKEEIFMLEYLLENERFNNDNTRYALIALEKLVYGKKEEKKEETNNKTIEKDKDKDKETTNNLEEISSGSGSGQLSSYRE